VTAVHPTTRYGIVSVALAAMLLTSYSFAQQLSPAGTEAAPAQASSGVSQGVNGVHSSSPEVIYEEGKLSIRSDGSTLAEVLQAVAQKTGAVIDVPSGGGLERVVQRTGPAPADAVLTGLLTGSDFNFVIVTLPRTPHIPARVLLFPRGAVAPGVEEAAAAGPSSDTEPQLYGAGFAVSTDDTSADAAPPPPAQNDPPDAIPGPVLDQMQKDFLHQHEQVLQQRRQQQQQGGAPPSSQ